MNTYSLKIGLTQQHATNFFTLSLYYIEFGHFWDKHASVSFIGHGQNTLGSVAWLN